MRVFARNYNLAHSNLTGPNNPPLNSYWSGPMVASFVVSTPPLAITEIMYNPPWPASGTNDIRIAAVEHKGALGQRQALRIARLIAGASQK